ncbi:cytochrome P450 CYP82D47-like [Tripterygium wilfordii]|uniref:cytochrome P450 CYP82D47-like n=1 Tax=Tripterygium wilfordii TaxID=458696 RepID=UPI0018F84A39|nr:cytochrome P450 CYP82D47-like [Tripterygium wilfordii]
MDFPSNLTAIPGLLVLILSLLVWKHRLNSTKKTKVAPTPSGALPIIGHLPQLSKPIPLARTLGSMADKYGPIFTIRLGMHRVLVISDSEAVKECFTTHDRVLASRPISSHAKYLGYNSAGFGFAPYGAFWRNIRKIVMLELLSSQRLSTLKEVQVSEVNTLISDLYLLCKNEIGPIKVVISDYFERTTLNIITRMIAGKRYFGSVGGDDEEAQRVGKIIKGFMYISGAFALSDLIPFLGWLDFMQPTVKYMKRIFKELDSVAESWVEEHKLKRIDDADPNNKQDFIDVMLSAIYEDSMSGHSRETIIKATVLNLIIAGADTTSTTITWILSNLLNNRHTLKLAQEELDQKVGRDRLVQDSDIENLVYLQAIIKETLRLYPPGPLLVPHIGSEDCTISGYHLPKGTRVFVNAWKMHRNPDVWSNPDKFMAERFLTSNANVDVLGQHFELLPFGSGRRSCPGMTFALQVVHLMVGRLVQGFEFSTPGDGPVDMSEGLGITLPKASPLEVMVSPRLCSDLY